MLEQTVTAIEEAIRHFGVDPDEFKVEGQYKWKLSRGSASIRVRIFDYDETRHGVEVCAYMMHLPEDPDNRSGLFQTVLTMNDSMVGNWFSIRENYLYLISNRDIEGLDKEEVVRTIDDLSYYADRYDDKLKADFGDD